MKKIIISKDDAVFWLDANGRWHNRFGPFQHKKIIDFFHSSIRKDKDGYYLTQTINDTEEKVYFRCEDGAIFVFDIIDGNDLILLLNTGKKIKLRPGKLWIKHDSLYMQHGDEQIKFTEHSLMKISDFIENKDGRYCIIVKNRKYEIPELCDEKLSQK